MRAIVEAYAVEWMRSFARWAEAAAASSRQIVEGLRNVAIAMRALAETLEAIEMEEWRRETQGLWLI